MTVEDQNADESIVDISNQSYKIESDYGLQSNVPAWSHQYIYSYAELNNATKEQKRFYTNFKVSFLQGDFMDLEGNTNYAFILLFDLLNQFEVHKSLVNLENQFRKLGEQYPKTKSYVMTFLVKTMKSAGDKEGATRIEAEQYDYQNSQVNYSTYEWRNKHSKTLNLNKEEIEILNRIWYNPNSFLSIDFCASEIIRLYIGSIGKLARHYLEKGILIDEEFKSVATIFASIENTSGNANNQRYLISNFITEFHTILFKECENSIRDYYGHKRKLGTEPTIAENEMIAAFEERILLPARAIIWPARLNAKKPDIETEKKLNTLNTSRWKAKLEKIQFAYLNNHNRFFEKVVLLGEENDQNPAVENIFFEASKFFATHNKEIALKLYIYYLHYDLKSAVFDNKQFTKTIQKNLFANNIQLHDFQVVVSDFLNDRDLEKALLSVPQIYAPKRKRIQLDINSIKEVQKQHSGTVELLNVYLKDDFEDANNSFKTEEISAEEIRIEITPKNSKTCTSKYLGSLAFTVTHTSTLELFFKNNYSLLQSELELFAKAQGAFKNQLIDSINEICYEDLDDVLIEEDEEYYTINENYYQRLIVK